MAALNTFTRGEHRVFEFWLVFAFDGVIRIAKREPQLDRSERAIFMSVKLPLTLWDVPSLRAEIGFPEGTTPKEMRVAVEGVVEAVRSATGLDIDLHINPPPET